MTRSPLPVALAADTSVLLLSTLEVCDYTGRGNPQYPLDQ